MTSNVKDAIVQLCRMLKHGNICSCVAPEHFRQAKHNKPEVIPAMLQLLFSIFSHLSNDSSLHVEPEMLPKLMKKYGYPRVDVLSPSKSSLESKELLFCFAWLLHCCRIIDDVRDEALRNCDSFHVLLQEKKKSTLSKDALSNAQKSEDRVQRHSGFQALSVTGQNNYVSWLMGRIEINLNRLKSLQVCKTKLTTEITRMIHEVVQESNKTISTVDDLLLLKYPSIMQLCEKELEQKIQVLQAYLKWKELESVFWMWLDGTLENDYDSINDEATSQHILHCSDVNSNLMVLTNKITQLKTLLFEKQRAWMDQAKVNPDKLRLRLEQEHEVEREVSTLFQRIGDHAHSPAILPSDDGKKEITSLPLSVASFATRENIVKLQSELLEMQRLCGEEVTMISNTKFGDKFVLIPPPGKI